MAAWAQLFAAGVLDSIWLLATAVRTLPLGIAYAVWTRNGALGVGLVGIAGLKILEQS